MLSLIHYTTLFARNIWLKIVKSPFIHKNNLPQYFYWYINIFLNQFTPQPNRKENLTKNPLNSNFFLVLSFFSLSSLICIYVTPSKLKYLSSSLSSSFLCVTPLLRNYIQFNSFFLLSLRWNLLSPLFQLKIHSFLYYLNVVNLEWIFFYFFYSFKLQLNMLRM